MQREAKIPDLICICQGEILPWQMIQILLTSLRLKNKMQSANDVQIFAFSSTQNSLVDYKLKLLCFLKMTFAIDILELNFIIHHAYFPQLP